MKKQVILLVIGLVVFNFLHAQVNMESWITLNVKKGENIGLLLMSVVDETSIRIESGSTVIEKTIMSKSSPTHWVYADSTIITIYGDVNSLNASSLQDKLLGVDITNNTKMKILICNYNQINSIKVRSENIELKYIYCFGNQLTDCALDDLFHSLPQRPSVDSGKVFIKGYDYSNPGVNTCRDYYAWEKGWYVLEYNSTGNIEFHNFSFTCPETGIQDIISSENVFVFPNPAEKQLTIQSDINIVDIEIFDISAKRVFYHPNLNSNINLLDISHLSEGLYVMKITTEKGIENKKLIVR